MPFRVFSLLLAAAAAPAPLSISWERPADIATGGGEKGPWRQNASRYDYVDDATAAFGADGTLHVAWVEQERKDVLFQSLDERAQPRQTAVNISRSPGTFSWLPRIATAPDDAAKLCVLWQEIIFSGGSHGGEILFARSLDGGASFTPPVNLSNSVGGDGKGRINRQAWSNGSLDLVAGPGGLLIAAWTEYDGALWLARSTDMGASFSAPRRLAGDDARPARSPSLALGPGKTVYLAWTVGETPGAAIRVAQSDDGGATFGEPSRVGAGAGYADAPRLAVDRDGVLHLVFAYSGAGPFGRSGVRYAASTRGAAGFGVTRAISAPGAAYPVLGIDRAGKLFVLWEAMPGAANRPQGLGYAVSRDGGRSFTAPGIVPGSADTGGGANGSQQGLLGKKLAVSGDGRIAVVNSSLEAGKRSRVWLMRGR